MRLIDADLLKQHIRLSDRSTDYNKHLYKALQWVIDQQPTVEIGACQNLNPAPSADHQQDGTSKSEEWQSDAHYAVLD